MIEIREQKISSAHSAEDIWQAINTPLSPEVCRIVNPYVSVWYQGLTTMQSLLRDGVRIIYEPDLAELEPVLGMATAMLPKDVELRVADYDPRNKARTDVLESEKHSGSIRQRVEEVDGIGLLVVEGEISLGGSKKVFEGPIGSYAERGIAAHNQRILDNIPVILGH